MWRVVARVMIGVVVSFRLTGVARVLARGERIVWWDNWLVSGAGGFRFFGAGVVMLAIGFLCAIGARVFGSGFRWVISVVVFLGRARLGARDDWLV